MRAQTLVVVAILLQTLGCSAADQPSVAERELVFDLEAEDVEAAAAVYAPDADVDELLAQLAAPFDCSRFAEACEAMGPERAQELVEDMWTLARDGAPAEEISESLKIGFAPLAGAPVSSTSSAICSFAPNLRTISVTATKVSLGLFSVGSISYHSQRTLALGPAWGVVDHPVDATLELEISTLGGVTTFAGSTSVTAQAEATFSHSAPGPFFLVDGEVTATGCPAVAASI